MNTSKQLVLFFILGGILTLAEWSVFYILVYSIEIGYIISSIITFLLFTLIGLYVYKKLIFKQTQCNTTSEILKTYLINMLTLLIHILVLDFSIRAFKLEALEGKIIASFVSAFLGFFARKKWIYQN